MSKRLFRPSFQDYKTGEQLTAERTQTAQRSEQNRIAQNVRDRRETFHILQQGLPLLQRHVQLSPVEIPRRSRRGRRKDVTVTGGWPLGEIYLEWGESYYGLAGSRYEFFVVTEDGHFGHASAVENRQTLFLDRPHRLTEANLVSYDPGFSGGYSFNPSSIVPGPLTMRQRIASLLDEAGVAFPLQ